MCAEKINPTPVEKSHRLVQRGIAALNADNPSEAILNLEQALGFQKGNPDAYYYLAEAALMDPGTTANIAAQYAAAGIAAFVEQAGKPITVWRGTDAMDTVKNEPCQVFSLDLRNALVVEQITSGFGELVKSRCKVLSQLMEVIKQNSSQSTFEMNKQALLQIEGLDWSKNPWDEEVQCEGQNEIRCKEARQVCENFSEEYLQ